MNQALPKKLWDRLGLVSILDTINGLSAWPEPPYTEPYVRWCERTADV